jgi:DNA-binding NtrC family response regulator
MSPGKSLNVHLREYVMRQTSPDNRPLALIVENNAFIGMYLTDDLDDQGYATAGPFACTGAVKWLAANTPDIAILDVDLQSGPCVALARELKQRGVPIIVYSAHEQRYALPEFQDELWIPIPASTETLRQALANH